MLGETITITVNAIAKTLSKINNDNYSCEYFLKEATQEFRVKTRHAKEKSLVLGSSVDRHNVELTQTIYPTSSYPLGIQRQVYVVIRNNPIDDPVAIDQLSDGLADFVKTNGPGLVGWQS